ncbi:MetQ/NlpA family ABC transporter substrate-binding protein [Dialister sp.]|uniref:MetQ/NlpA family ABC transporter substrate-binding protein n=1 Tax=Dialister sp. TaxID=1955814 RepID=UPI002E8071C7|nr:MetQ/NlpA family ABC transporter substrate-binding protein [Dialister sp.]MEE3452873.1 MetQ/NlpA family ABC transporter substrate-binding protein [Dialister sp.]
MNFKKAIIASLAALAAVGFIAGCGGEKAPAKSAAASSAAKAVSIKVGVSPVPHAEIVNVVKDKLAKEGVNVELVEFNDYVQPNLALNDKSLDANFFQHKPYLEEFCKSRNLKLVSIGAVHLEPMGVYSNKIKDIKALPEGAHVAIPNDPTNGGRALLVLQSAGLIKLKEGAPITATPQDIASNPKNLKFSELDAPQLPRALEDADIAIINSNFALAAKLDPKNAIYTEGADSPYANIVAVRAGDEKRPELQKLMKALQSKEVKDFIEKKYGGSVKAAF